MSAERRSFYPVDEVVSVARHRLDAAAAAGETVDYITLVPDGEPTLDINLGELIERLGTLGPRIAVISNASLVWDAGVRTDLARADWVSLKIDAATEEAWKRINRPHGGIALARILEGARRFAKAFDGTLASETMLVDGINDGVHVIAETASVVGEIAPDIAYISVPTRPPAEPSAGIPEPAQLVHAFEAFAERVRRAELLIAYEGSRFAVTGSAEKELMGTTAVHPMREEAVGDLLRRAGADWSVVRGLIERGLLVELTHAGHRFYMNRLPGRRGDGCAGGGSAKLGVGLR